MPTVLVRVAGPEAGPHEVRLSYVFADGRGARRQRADPRRSGVDVRAGDAVRTARRLHGQESSGLVAGPLHPRLEAELDGVAGREGAVDGKHELVPRLVGRHALFCCEDDMERDDGARHRERPGDHAVRGGRHLGVVAAQAQVLRTPAPALAPVPALPTRRLVVGVNEGADDRLLHGDRRSRRVDAPADPVLSAVEGGVGRDEQVHDRLAGRERGRAVRRARVGAFRSGFRLSGIVPLRGVVGRRARDVRAAGAKERRDEHQGAGVGHDSLRTWMVRCVLFARTRVLDEILLRRSDFSSTTKSVNFNDLR